MVGKMPPATIAVAEESLTAIMDFPENVKQAVAMVLDIVQENPSKEHFEPCKMIPDDAPDKVKNEIADGQGRAFKVAVAMKGAEDAVAFSWYEPYDRRLVFFWYIDYPVEAVIREEP